MIRQILTTTWIIGAGFLLFPSFSFATLQNIVSQKNITSPENKSHFHYEYALTEIAEMLLIEPDNNELYAELDQLMADPEFPSEYKILLYQFRDLITFNTVLRSDIETLKNNNHLLRSRLIGAGMQEDLINRKIKAEIKKYPDLKRISQIADVPKKIFLNEVNATLELEKRHLLAIKEQVINEYNDLLAIKNEYFLKNRFETKPSKKYMYAKRFYTSDGKSLLEPKTIAIVKSREREVQEANVLHDLQKEIKQAQMKYDILHSLVASKDERIAKMQTDIVDLTMQVTQNDKTISQKNRAIANMTEQIEELDSRFQLSQQIIKNKTEEINQLQDKILKVENLKNQKAELKKQLEQARANLKKSKKTKRNDLEKSKDLRNQIQKLESELALSQKRVQTKQQLIANLKQERAENNPSNSNNLPEFAMVTDKLEEQKDINKDLTQKLQQLKSKMYTLQMGKLDSHESISVETAQVEQLNQKIEDLTLQLDSKNEIIAKLLGELNLPSDTGILNANKELRQVNNKLVIQQEKLQSRLAKLNSELTALKTENAQLPQNQIHPSILQINNAELQKFNKKLKNELDNTWEIIKAKDAEIAKLKRTSQSYTDTPSTTDTQPYIDYIYQLEGILGLYKEELSDAKNVIKSNNANISTLEEQLTLVQTQLYQKDEILQNTQNMLNETQQQMDVLKKELDRLRQSQNQANMSDDERRDTERKYYNLFIKTKQLNAVLSMIVNEITSFTHNFKLPSL